jgi:cation:H+ antiporter
MRDQPRSSGVSLLPVVGALTLSLPWIALTLQGFHGSSLLVAALAGLAILGAAFVLSWAAELVQMDVSQALALALLALIAVLPEYAVDAVFAFEAGRDPAVAQAGYAVANMTGGNRLLIGIGWSSVMLLAWWRHGARRVALDRGQVLEMSVLLLATEDAPAMPFKGELNLPDTGVLASLFCLYLRAARSLLPIGVAHLISYIS